MVYVQRNHQSMFSGSRFTAWSDAVPLLFHSIVYYFNLPGDCAKLLCNGIAKLSSIIQNQLDRPKQFIHVLRADSVCPEKYMKILPVEN